MRFWLHGVCLSVLAIAAGCLEAPAVTDGSTSDALSNEIAKVDPSPSDDGAPSASVGTSEPVAEGSAATPAPDTEPAETAESSGAESSGAEFGADKASATQVKLTPDNTSIQFIGNHTGDDPKPRRGRFQQFQGTAVVDGSLQSVEVQIQTASLTTEIEKLTNHLKNADFFDVRRYPQASFKSTAIKDLGEGKVEITGDLTLLDKTNQVTFPAMVSTDGGLTLKAEFEIDRTRWGMNYGLDGIEKQVPMTITIGG